jgi:mannose-6-phosphate isomerase-like protein (cupin superfamily)
MCSTMFMNAKLGHLEVIDVPSRVAACEERWHNSDLAQVNDSLVRLGIFEGEFHFHKHDREDEFFFVLSGRLLLDVEGRGTVELTPHQGYTVPMGVIHRTRAEEKTVVLMVEKDTVRPRGDP